MAQGVLTEGDAEGAPDQTRLARRAVAAATIRGRDPSAGRPLPAR